MSKLTSRKVLDKVLGVVSERLTVQRVQHGVTRAIGSGGAAVCLSALAVLERLTTERTLVNLALLGTRERQAKVLELENGVGSLTAPVESKVMGIEAIDGCRSPGVLTYM